MTGRKRLAILGASGHGKVVADIAIQAGWQEIVFYDDAWPDKASLEYWRVEGSMAMLLCDLSSFDGVAVAIGHNVIREAKLEALIEHGARLVTLIHPRATVSPMARLDVGCVVVAGAIVNAFADLGMGTIVNTGATVGHDCRLDACVHVAPGANVAGDVKVGRGSWIGVGAAVRQGLVIGERVMVGAGAAVVSNLDDDLVVAGVPARPLHGAGPRGQVVPISPDTQLLKRIGLVLPKGGN